MRLLCLTSAFAIIILVAGCYTYPEFYPAIYYTNVPNSYPLTNMGSAHCISYDVNIATRRQTGYAEAGDWLTEEHIFLNRLNYGWTFGDSGYCVSLGAFGYLGNYSIDCTYEPSTYSGTHSVYGFGPQLSCNAYARKGIVSFGVGGYTAPFYFESGEYARLMDSDNPLFFLGAVYPFFQVDIPGQANAKILSRLFTIGLPGYFGTDLALFINNFYMWFGGMEFEDGQRRFGGGIGICLQGKKENVAKNGNSAQISSE